MTSPRYKEAPLLEVKNLSTHFVKASQTIKAVDDVSFKVYKGETVGIVGESGSGKSVTALSLMRLITPPSGNVVNGVITFYSPTLGKTEITQLSPKVMRSIRGSEMAMIFQEPMSSLNPVFSCGDQVMEAILLHKQISHKEARELTIQLFEKVQLPTPASLFYTYPHELSGGQKQRVMIAMAISCHPQLLIADEPTTALDVTVQADILQLLRDIRDEFHTSVIFISHDLGVIAEIADKVVVMYQGKIVEQGTAQEVFSNPQHPYTKGLLACRPRLDVKQKILPTIANFMSVDEQGKIKEKEAPDNKSKYSSVTEAILQNIRSQEEIQARQQKLRQQEPLLQVKGLKTYFANQRNLFGRAKESIRAVDDVSFDVYPGETLGLVGESGCGKTTLGRSILQLIAPTAGEVIFEGRQLGKLAADEMRRVRKEMQIIFQDPYASLNPRITIGEAIMEPMKVHGVLENNKRRKEKVIELLETVNLNSTHFSRYPHEFSGGQRQRICIARTLALNPRFIICDESVSALDVSVQAQVLNLLNKLKEQFNFTCIFISHDLSVIKFISDRILVMSEGKIVASGYPEELFHNSENEYTRKLIAAIPTGELKNIRKKGRS